MQSEEEKQDWIHRFDTVIHVLVRAFLFFMIIVMAMQFLMLFRTVRPWLCPVDDLEGIPYKQRIIKQGKRNKTLDTDNLFAPPFFVWYTF